MVRVTREVDGLEGQRVEIHMDVLEQHDDVTETAALHQPSSVDGGSAND
jgi:hypothetical protein